MRQSQKSNLVRRDRGLFFLGLVTVQKDGENHQHRAHAKLDRQVEIEQVDGHHAGYYYGEGGRETFEDVIGVLDDQGYQQTAGGLQNHQVNDETIVAEKEAPIQDLRVVSGETSDQGYRQGQETQLDVPHPHRYVAPL